MLDDLDSIDWATLSDTAYAEPATQVPELIRALASVDADTGEAALFNLAEVICYVRADVGDAAAAAAPFLVELVAAPAVPRRGLILDLLTDIVEVGAQQTRQGSPPAASNADDEDGALALYQHWGALCVQAVGRQLSTVLATLDDLDPQVRICAPRLLASLARNAGLLEPACPPAGEELRRQVASRLRERFVHEPLELVRASLTLALGQVADEDPGHLAFLHALAGDSADRGVQLVAALCVAEQEAAWSEPLCHLLAEALTHSDATAARFQAEGLRFPWFEDGPAPLRLRLIRRLCRMARVWERLALPALWEELRAECRGEVYPLQSVSADILALLFPARSLPEGAAFTDLSPDQQEALELLYDTPALWNRNAIDLFDPYGPFLDEHARYLLKGMPPNRSAMRTFLGRTAATEDAQAILDQVARGALFLRRDEPLDAEACDRLERLRLSEVATDAMLPLLSRFPNLRRLDLSRSEVTDAGLAELPSLPNLVHLSLDRTGVTMAGVERLRRLRPSLQVSTDGTATPIP